MSTRRTTAAVAVAAGVAAVAAVTMITRTPSTPPPVAFASLGAYCYRAAPPGGEAVCRPASDFPGGTCPLGLVAVASCPPAGEPAPTAPPPTAAPTVAPTPPPQPTVVVPPISGSPTPMPTPGLPVPPISGGPGWTFPPPCASSPAAYRLQWRADPLDFYFLDVVPGVRGASVETEKAGLIYVAEPGIKSVPLNGTSWIAVTGAASAWLRNSSGSVIYPMQPIAISPCY